MAWTMERGINHGLVSKLEGEACLGGGDGEYGRTCGHIAAVNVEDDMLRTACSRIYVIWEARGSASASAI